MQGTPNQRDAANLWCRAGGSVAPVNRTGEWFWRHPVFDRPVRTNRRRKDAPRHLLAALRVLEAKGLFALFSSAVNGLTTHQIGGISKQKVEIK